MPDASVPCSNLQAAKYLDDFYYSNKHWAEVGGITTRELNALELELLFRLNFNLSIRREDYDSFVAQLVGDEPEGMMQIDDQAPLTAAAEAQIDQHWRVGEKTGGHSGMGGKKTSYVNVTDAARTYTEKCDDDVQKRKARSVEF